MNRDPLQNWQDWNLPGAQKPELLREISAGRTNRNFLIKAGHDLYILRINAGSTHALGIDRRREKSILELAGIAGLAPDIIYCSIDKGVLVTEFIDGQHWRPADLAEPAKLSLLLDGLHNIHTLPVSTPRFDYQKHAENYWQHLRDRNIQIPDNLHRQREKVLTMLANISTPNVICHQDPNPENIIVHAGRLYFLDWEYAAPAWPAFDFAALSVEWNISVDKLALPNDIDVNEFKQATDLYLYLCNLWMCLFGSEKPTG